MFNINNCYFHFICVQQVYNSIGIYNKISFILNLRVNKSRMSIFDMLARFGPLYDKQAKEKVNDVKGLNCKFFGLLFTA